jgi:iron(III) transport system ATP-binding protein
VKRFNNPGAVRRSDFGVRGRVRALFDATCRVGEKRRLVAAVQVLSFMLLCLHTTGCRPSSAGPTIPVTAVHSWAVPPDGVMQPAARKLTIGNHGEVIALDTDGRVLVYAPDGSIARQWRMPDNKNGNPEGVCVLRDGRIVVGDTHYHRVVVFAPDAKSFTTFGKEGRGPGEFIFPVAVTKDAQDNIYVAEYGSNDRVQKFTSDGKFLLAFGGFGTLPSEFQRPSGLVWHDGKIYAADAFNNRIQVFSDDGKFLEILGSAGQPLDLKLPYDLQLGADNTLYAIEYGAGRVTRFDLNGRLLGRYGTTGSGTGQFATPWGLAVDSQKRVYVADTGNRRIVELQTR